jgi:hypothetical protein
MRPQRKNPLWLQSAMSATKTITVILIGEVRKQQITLTLVGHVRNYDRHDREKIIKELFLWTWH